jgi:hypothetical protein
VIVDRYTTKNKRMWDCCSEILQSLDGFEDGPAPPTTEEKSASDTSGTTDSTQSGGMGQLYATADDGKKKAREWDFWMDENGNGWLLPLFKEADKLHSFNFTYGKNIISFERQMKDEFADDGRDVYTLEVPLTPEINVYNDNLIQVHLQPADEIEKILLRVDGIEYSLDGTMKLTCEKIADKTTLLTLAADSTQMKVGDKMALTAKLTYEGQGLVPKHVTIIDVDGKEEITSGDTKDPGTLDWVSESFGSEGIHRFQAKFSGDEDYLASESNEVTIYVAAAPAAHQQPTSRPKSNYYCNC